MTQQKPDDDDGACAVLMEVHYCWKRNENETVFVESTLFHLINLMILETMGIDPFPSSNNTQRRTVSLRPKPKLTR